MKNTQYSNGYWDKITYWTQQLQEAVANNNLSGVDSAHQKLDYFIQRQYDTSQTNPELIQKQKDLLAQYMIDKTP